MKKITIEISEKYADIISLTLVGGVGTPMLNTTVRVFDLSKGTRFIILDSAEWVQIGDDEKG